MNGWTAMPLADPPDPDHPWVASLQTPAGLFDLDGLWFATEEDALDFVHNDVIGQAEITPEPRQPDEVEPLHEWRCPSCNATTRARMADREGGA